MKLMAMGSEASVYSKGDRVVKIRKRKGYRLNEIDAPLRKSRTRMEFGIMKKCYSSGIRVPAPLKMKEEDCSIEMEKIEGIQFDSKFSTEKMKELGEMVAKMHRAGVVHGDLTTANILLTEKELVIIDFGLSEHTAKDESRATDIYLLKNALKSRHKELYEKAYDTFLDSYSGSIGKEFKGINAHLKDIEKRRRYNEDY